MSIIGFLAMTIVIVGRHNGGREKYFFLLYLFSLFYDSLVMFFSHSGVITEYPHFFRTDSPFFYCIPISFYLYYKSHSLKSAWKYSPDIYLLVIPIIHIIELMPFYMLDTSDKRDYLLSLSGNSDAVIYSSEGWIPNSWHFVLQLTLGLILFSSVLFQMSKATGKNVGPSFSNANWFKWAASLQLLSFSILLIFLIIDSPQIDIYGIATFVFIAIQLFAVLNLFLFPESLYGLSNDYRSEIKRKNISNASLTDEVIDSYKLSLDDFFIQDTSFLDGGFRQQDLANSLNISKNKLSYLINAVYELNFNQLLNKKRIEVVLKKMNEEDNEWDNLSLSGIGREVGFKSRTTFIKAFKFNTGMTPSQYLTTNKRSCQ